MTAHLLVIAPNSEWEGLGLWMKSRGWAQEFLMCGVSNPDLDIPIPECELAIQTWIFLFQNVS